MAGPIKRPRYMTPEDFKDVKMRRRMYRAREQIWKRCWMPVWIVLFWTCAPAIAVAVVATVWRLCALAVFS